MKHQTILHPIDAYRFKIPKESRTGMYVDGLIYSDAHSIHLLQEDGTLEQVVNVAMIKGFVGNSIAMPDAHQGYGFCIGGVAAADLDHGVVSTGGVGFDINCGVRLLSTDLMVTEVQPKIKTLIDQLFSDIPVGTGRNQQPKLSNTQMQELLEKGASWAIKEGMGTQEDLFHMESNGIISGAKPEKVSRQAIERGNTQCGTLGSGNHFVEVQVVKKIYNPIVAKAFGLYEDQVVIMIHTGSRGLGHQVCTDYLDRMQYAVQKYNIPIPDRQLACAPIHSQEGSDYIGAMSAAANFAFANRQILTHLIRNAVNKVFGKTIPTRIVYDIAHNIAKMETHCVNGKEKQVLVHRKGATRAFPKGHPELNDAYQSIGHPVLIPGSMGTLSYVMVGNPLAMEESFGSICHGAGRVMSRTKAKSQESMEKLMKRLSDASVLVRGQSKAGLLEESPIAYKDVDHVVEIVQNAGLAEKVAQLKPLAVIKG